MFNATARCAILHLSSNTSDKFIDCHALYRNPNSNIVNAEKASRWRSWHFCFADARIKGNESTQMSKLCIQECNSWYTEEITNA
jgi:hypothetical protein